MSACRGTVTGDGDRVGGVRIQCRIHAQHAGRVNLVVVAGDILRAAPYLAVGDSVRSGSMRRHLDLTRYGGNHLVAVGQRHGVKGADVLRQAAEHHGAAVIDMCGAVIVPFVAVSGDFNGFCNLLDTGHIRLFAAVGIRRFHGIIAIRKIGEAVRSSFRHQIVT